ncbi:hypothetical protein F2Q69_00021540 [Brassica cretica]|uniref:Uncharacterized protein n=1 Tax=Brassica cretica TaxID=69181 RepID=A0A8S9QID0_BRACR|nr:hypothetical protein F2Q69_00021540 [Brassica cretica]
MSGRGPVDAPLLLTVASEVQFSVGSLFRLGCMRGHVQVLLFRVWILSSIVEFSGSAFKVMAFSSWFWLCLEMFVAMAFFFNGEASRAAGPFLSLGLVVLQSLWCWSFLIGGLSLFRLAVPLKPPVV